MYIVCIQGIAKKIYDTLLAGKMLNFICVADL